MQEKLKYIKLWESMEPNPEVHQALKELGWHGIKENEQGLQANRELMFGFAEIVMLRRAESFSVHLRLIPTQEGMRFESVDLVKAFSGGRASGIMMTAEDFVRNWPELEHRILSWAAEEWNPENTLIVRGAGEPRLLARKAAAGWKAARGI